MVDYDPDDPNVRPCDLKECWFRIPGKHKDRDTAWGALEDLIATRNKPIGAVFKRAALRPSAGWSTLLEFEMKFLSLTALIFVSCHGSVAQTSECSAIPKARERLACYDRAIATTVREARCGQAESGGSQLLSDQGSHVDALATKTRNWDAKLKKILPRVPEQQFGQKPGLKVKGEIGYACWKTQNVECRAGLRLIPMTAARHGHVFAYQRHPISRHRSRRS